MSDIPFDLEAAKKAAEAANIAKSEFLAAMSHEITLDQAIPTAEALLAGQVRGRVVVQVGA